MSSKRISQKILLFLHKYIQQELTPWLRNQCIQPTQCKVSPDQHDAYIGVSIYSATLYLSEKDQKGILRLLQERKQHIKKKLGNTMGRNQLRRTPSLHFYRDQTTAVGAKIGKKVAQLLALHKPVPAVFQKESTPTPPKKG